ncbi:MAG: dynamin family protein [Syntrophales bacterium]
MDPEQKTMSTILLQGLAADLLGKVGDICARFQIVSLERPLEACKSLLSENPFIDIAVLGQFKAGKSSFINSLIGKSILPVGVIPVTTVITRIHYGEKERAVISYFDGTSSEVGIDRLDEFTSEAKNPSNEKNVEIVDIELPSFGHYPGLRLVDTPGLGSIFKYHMKVSENWLPEVGAALLAISSDRPLSDNDLQLIRELMQYTPKIALLLTKVDLLSPEQQTEVVKFFKDTLLRELNRELPIYLYSNRIGTEQFKDRMEKELLSRLSLNRDFEFGKILQYKTSSLVRNCLSYLDIALRTSLQADLDREGLSKQILDEKVNYDLIREELSIISRENQRQTRLLIMNYLDGLQRPLKIKLVQKLAREMREWKGNLWRLTRRYEEWVAETMTEEMRQVSKTEHRHFYGTLKKAHASFSRSLEAFRNLLNSNVEKVLGVKLAEADWKIEVMEPFQPDIRTPRSFDIHLDLIWFLIPMFLFRGAFERYFLGKIPREVETNLSRLAAQWEDSINKTIKEMQKQALQYVKDELSTIDALLSKTQGQTDEIRRTINELRSRAEQLSRFESDPAVSPPLRENVMSQ